MPWLCTGPAWVPQSVILFVYFVCAPLRYLTSRIILYSWFMSVGFFPSCTLHWLVLNFSYNFFARSSRWPRFRLCANLIRFIGVSMTPFLSLYKITSCDDLGTFFVRTFFLWWLFWCLSVYIPTFSSLNVGNSIVLIILPNQDLSNPVVVCCVLGL